MMGKRAVVLVNGELRHPEQARQLAGQADLLVAADGGCRHALALGLWPHWVVGDLDSLDAQARATLAQNGVQLVEYPAWKDETDLELALLHAVQHGAREIMVLAALGGRTDQALANILLLALPELADTRTCIVEGQETIYLIRERLTIAGQPGDLLSLIPVGGDCHGIWTQGLEYPLAGGTLWLARARGISNVFVETRATIRVEQGLLLAIHRAQEPPGHWPAPLDGDSEEQKGR